jgi:pyrroline-5-carboxylate reductase
MRIGFLGTGRISQAVVTGLCSVVMPPERITLSPRNAGIAAELARRFSNVRIAADNAEVVAASEIVVVAVRPDDAEVVLRRLPFRAGQKVLSLMALVPLTRVRELVAPAGAVRLLPLPTIAQREGPIVLYPHADWAEKLLEPLGEIVAAGSEAELETLWTATALIAPFMEHLAAVGRWLEAQGVATARADRYTRSMFAGLARLAATSEATLAELRDEAQTPGGLNEQALRELRGAGSFDALQRSLDAIAARLAAAHHSG